MSKRGWAWVQALRPKRFDWLIIAVTLLILASMTVPSAEVGSSSHYTCALCRARRTCRITFGHVSEQIQETSCSNWYAAHVEEHHEHLWVYSGSTVRLNIFGQAISVGDQTTRNPIWRISPEEQMEIYGHFKDLQVARKLFSHIGEQQKEPFTEAERTVDSLLSWREAGYPNSWEQWNDSHQRQAPQGAK
ncbi:MAG: hypothetical protein ABSA67_06725 [Candidatus Brocadiia bacterium]